MPDVNFLKKIYHIYDAENVTFLEEFPQYQDIIGYGSTPNCLNESGLLTLNSEVDWHNMLSFQIRNNKNLYVCSLKNAFVCPGRIGTFFDSSQQFLFNIFVSPGDPIFWPLESDIHNFSLHTYKKIATVQGPTYFYHWLIDRLPSVFLLRDLIIHDPEIKLIINCIQSTPKYVTQYLELLGIPLEKCIIPQSSALYQAETLFFATPFLMEPIPRKLLLSMRSELISSANLKNGKSKYANNLIVIVQRNDSNRQISNLDELVDLLRSSFKGYEIIIFDGNMNISEQIQIFNNAKLVIGAMASGLANVLYLNPRATVIEIHPQFTYLDKFGKNNCGNEWVWWLSSAVGANYWFVIAPYKLSDAFIHCPIFDIKKIIANIITTMD